MTVERAKPIQLRYNSGEVIAVKKLLITVLSLAVISYALFADVETEYNRKRLVIQYYSGISGSWSEKGGSISSYSNWRFHEGFRKIT